MGWPCYSLENVLLPDDDHYGSIAIGQFDWYGACRSLFASELLTAADFSRLNARSYRARKNS